MSAVTKVLSIAEFNGIMLGAAEVLMDGMEILLDRAAEIVQDEAKAELGTYQGGIGIFEAWKPLAEQTQEERDRQGYDPDEPLLRSGVLRDNIERSTGVFEAAVGVPDKIVTLPYDPRPVSIGDIAVWQELGTERIPPRSFLGGAAMRKGDEVAELIGRDVTLLLAGGDSLLTRLR